MNQDIINEAQSLLEEENKRAEGPREYITLRGNLIKIIRDLIVPDNDHKWVHLHLRVDCKLAPGILDGIMVEFSNGNGLTIRSTIQKKKVITDLVPRGNYTIKLITEE